MNFTFDEANPDGADHFDQRDANSVGFEADGNVDGNVEANDMIIVINQLSR